MGCGPGVAGKSRIAGVFVASITFSTRMPGSITRESITPRMRAAMATATAQQLVRALMTFLWSWQIEAGRASSNVHRAPGVNVIKEGTGTKTPATRPLSFLSFHLWLAGIKSTVQSKRPPALFQSRPDIHCGAMYVKWDAKGVRERCYFLQIRTVAAMRI